MRRVCKDARRKNLAVLAETLRQNRFFPAKLSSSNIEAVALPEHLKMQVEITT